MGRVVALFVALLVGTGLSGCVSEARVEDAPPSEGPVALDLVASGMHLPVAVAFDPDVDNLMWVVQKDGRVHIIWDGIVAEPPALDVRDAVSTTNWEEGLLDLVFHPTDPRVFARMTLPADNDTDPERPHRVAIVEYPYGTLRNYTIDAANGTVLLEVHKAKEQHNGGSLAFGPDGYLYAGFGEGGMSDEARNHSNLLGTIVRLDVSTPGTYMIPPDNPFVDTPGVRPEIWQYGVRNPWKMDFDPATGDLWVADVGGARREEINRIPVGAAGQDFGWGPREGDVQRAPSGANASHYTSPVHAYATHSEDDGGRFRCAITGGVLYRGNALPWLQGQYVFSDLCSGAVYALSEAANGTWEQRTLIESHRGIVAIETDHAGELLVVNHDFGTVRRIVPG